MVASIHRIRKNIKIRNSETNWKVAEDSNKSQTGQKTDRWNWKTKKFEENEKKRCSIEQIDLYIMWE